MALAYEYSQRTIQNFVYEFSNGHLNLEPGFQRESVWTQSDRRKLIETIFQNYPIPSIFLYKREDDGKLMYDVLDGKQRLESLLMFQGLGRFRGKRFTVRTQLGSEEVQEWDWRRVRQRGHEHQFMGYKVQTVEVSGDLPDIINLFVRINSTGKKLTGAEQRHAKYFKSEFLKEAGKLARQYQAFFLDNRVLSSGQISRMRHIEIVCELLTSIYYDGPINKKKVLDDVIKGHRIDKRAMLSCKHEFLHTLKLVKLVFPDLRTTRFSKVADFYSLFIFIYELHKQNSVLRDKKRNQQAQKLLIWLSNGVDLVRQRIREAKGATPDQRLFADYLFTVQGDTDSLATRKRRGDILRQVLGGVFEQKDERRSFTPEQRRLIWHSDERKKCSSCRELLTWNNFTIDHIKPYALGGKTDLSNASLKCRPCNSRKGVKT